MQRVKNLIPLKLPASLVMIDGVCSLHGASKTLVRAGYAWFCPTCHELEVSAQVLQRWREARQADLLHGAHIPLKYQGQKFIAETDAQHRVRGMVNSFLNVLAESRQWATLALCGPVGTGKTRLACELATLCATELLRSVRYLTANDMISQIQASYSTEGKSEAGEIDRLVSYELLIIDEIDAKATSDNAHRLLTEIINRRYNANKPVIVISNQVFSRLKRFVGDRVHDRLYENSFVCNFDWPGYRRTAQLSEASAQEAQWWRENASLPRGSAAQDGGNARL